MTNCKNCGAPLPDKTGKCEYCRTNNETHDGNVKVVMDGKKIGQLVEPRIREVILYADDKPIYVE